MQRGEFALLPLLVAIPYGLLASSLLYINQFPDYQADARAGKHHLVVRFGPQVARWGCLLLVVSANVYLPVMVAAGYFSSWLLLSLLVLPAAISAAIILLRKDTVPERLEPAIRLSIASVVLHGLLLALCLVFSGSGSST